MPEDRAPRYVSLVHGCDRKPKRRLFEVIRQQGLQADQDLTFLTDGGEEVRSLTELVTPEAEHVLDCWGGWPLLPALRCRNVVVGRGHNGRSRPWERLPRPGWTWRRTCSKSMAATRWVASRTARFSRSKRPHTGQPAPPSSRRAQPCVVWRHAKILSPPISSSAQASPDLRRPQQWQDPHGGRTSHRAQRSVRSRQAC